MTGRSRRGVKFPHAKHTNGHGTAEGRRSSFSDVSEEGSQLSPLKPKPSPTLDGIQEKPTAQEERAAEYEKKKANFVTRTFWTFVMIGGFFAALFMGHVYIITIITVIQIVSFKEVIAIANVPSRARDLQSTKNLNWYWLATTMYFLYGESVIYYFKHIVLIDKVLLPLATHHRFISFLLYVFGFVFFVGSLKAGHLKFQFAQFGWTHMALFLINCQAHFIMNNIFEGMIWFFLPAALVITNDIFAYICGITFGRTQLIKLSPKKTVEGFVGAWIMTVLFGIVLTHYLMKSKFFICPVNDLGANFFTGLECDPNPIHTFFWATFASLIAPFGGFFASGLKRTFKIKDFGHSIPGHGGMTDRMDCQFIMGFFAYIYYHTFIALNQVTLGDVMENAITGLTVDEQIELIKGMGRYLANQGVVGPDALSCLDTSLPSRR
ncbi:cytidylyltransferase-like protein [Bombardia bombarda]|uniref:Phosphatidate cytidylyltransferase n=1 Tax=Bombardia bombarda TaxID=252184 RepID=A0AA40C1M8_9PEZI|nr:cytidylyltransferase-like protein [Bombardia bombarda]